MALSSQWNYPISLLLKPLVGAISAGNVACLKPSEVSVNCSRVLFDLIPRYIYAHDTHDTHDTRS
jgi:acyl-CoA reductase-like NAD-dependent aldehyde dehydrogenase